MELNYAINDGLEMILKVTKNAKIKSMWTLYSAN